MQRGVRNLLHPYSDQMCECKIINLMFFKNGDYRVYIGLLLWVEKGSKPFEAYIFYKPPPYHCQNENVSFLENTQWFR